ncbi:MAG TPA: helix-turn-helix domain-containing protein [Chakrabartia sp.]|jgi:AraC-like DNA-binding protein|nr:helix-turn-helix domain-containing protein [Chakrabartia sp.]
MLESRNYPPPDDLKLHIRRFYVFQVPLPDDSLIEDSLLAENAFVRVLLKGEWQAETTPGHWHFPSPALLFGSNSAPLPVRVKGGFHIAGFAVRPSAWRTLFAQPASDYVNQMVPLANLWGDVADTMLARIQAAPDDEAMVDAMVDAIRTQMKRIGRKRVDEKIQQFEVMARQDSTIKIEHAARDLGLSVRQMERRCMACYGLTPKSILRRSRFLDMAEAMRGFSTPGQKQLAELRYFDQSHLNREFHRFAGMTPGKFRKADTPMFTAGLHLRVLGKEID